MAKRNKKIKTQTVLDVILGTRKAAVKSKQVFRDKKKAATADATGRHKKHKERD